MKRWWRISNATLLRPKAEKARGGPIGCRNCFAGQPSSVIECLLVAQSTSTDSISRHSGEH
ncbi:hypothetical protein EA462_06150 [Natrarchaeobius halalkaliphilus]|uniref:Uncharacterized protein n=1 Tax=Natrarchaeobius halalkaliphilus TaxID=1679091 RepID=A0A3N6LPT8_9EURY|nr:hypothetical protein EA462_06150 [Natrarchaeobius halalkaliphilus]